MKVNDLYIIIGFLFLAFIPIWLFWLRDYKKLSLVTKSLIIFSVVYWIVWAIYGEGIPWYGIVGFLPLSLAVAILPDKVKKPRWLSCFLAIMIGLTFLDIAYR